MTKSRTQRRMEKKQTLILLVLVLAVSLASFFLGAVVGRQGAEREMVQKQAAAERILVAKAPKEAAASQSAEEHQETEATAAAEKAKLKAEEPKLTFYDDLAKEETVPLGSGINLPPKAKEEPITAAQPPILLPDQPIVKKDAAPVSTLVAKAEQTVSGKDAAERMELLPIADPDGNYAVQVGSFASAGDAGAFKKKLLAKQYPAFVLEADLGAKGLWYRVKIGPYVDAAAAKSVQQLLEKKEKIKGFVAHQ